MTDESFIAADGAERESRASRRHTGAPKTDVEARALMLEVWKENKSLELAEVNVIDVKPWADIEATWDEFFVSHHYMVTDNASNFYLFQHPRRSCDAFAAATLMCSPWQDNPFPRFDRLEDLQGWVAPPIAEEGAHGRDKSWFSGKPLRPNVAIEP